MCVDEYTIHVILRKLISSAIKPSEPMKTVMINTLGNASCTLVTNMDGGDGISEENLTSS